MKRRQKLIFKPITWLLLIFLSLTPLSFLIFSCGQEINNNKIIDEAIRKEREENFRSGGVYYSENQQLLFYKQNQPINYLAFGDAIGQGFFGIPLVAGPGFIDNQGNIEGVSYPSFLANLINSSQPDKINSFNNLSLTGSSVYNWNYILNPEDPRYNSWAEDTTRKLYFNQDLAQNHFFNFETSFKENFNLDSNTTFEAIIEKVKDANLITISLGSTTLFEVFFNITRDLLINLRDKGINAVGAELVKKILREHGLRAKRIVNNFRIALQHLTTQLKNLNPRAAIILISHPYTQFLLLEQLINSLWNLKEAVFTTILQDLNKAIREVARRDNLSFVNIFSKSWELSSRNDLIDTFLDPHPSINAQRWIARQIFLKLAIPIDTLEDYLGFSNYLSRTNWLGVNDRDYISFDFGEFRKEIYFSPEVEAKLSWLLRKLASQTNPKEEVFRPWSNSSPTMPQIINNILNKINPTSLTRLVNFFKGIQGASPELEKRSVGELVDELLSYLRIRYRLISIQPFWEGVISELTVLAKTLIIEIGKEIDWVNFEAPKVTIFATILSSLLSPDILLLIKTIAETLLKDIPPLSAIFAAIASILNPRN